jgi:hypothetical protein
MSDPEPQDVPLPQVVFENVNFEAIGMDPRDAVPPDLVAWCASAIAQIVPDPATVRLVVVGDFVDAVNRRQDPSEPPFTLARNGGMVGAKTMRAADSTVEILMPAWPLLLEFAGAEREQAHHLARRTMVHEAGHAAMMQRGQDDRSYDGLPRVDAELLAIADGALDEYRAEAIVHPDLRGEDPWWELEGVASTLVSNLRQIACVDYQAHHDVQRLMNAVLVEINTAVKILAVHAAQGGTAPTEGSAPQWESTLGRHWPALHATFSNAPDGLKAVGRDELASVASALAVEIADLVGTLGFTMRNHPAGGAEFLISDWSLYLD